MRRVNLMSGINRTGYGITGANIAKELSKLCDLNVQTMGGVEEILLNEDVKRSISNNIHNHCPESPLVKIWHQFALQERIGNGKYFGWPIFELDRFNDVEISHLNVPDELICCSEWARGILGKFCNKPISVIPLGVDREIFKESSINDDSTYRFFTVGKLEYRKGHDFLVNCFHKAFSKKDDVELHMMVSNLFLPRATTNEWYGNFKKGKLGDKIKFYNPVDDQRDVARFINSNDCGLFPSRAEGWNLELLESMSCNKPVIATNNTGHTEYCNDKNSFLINSEETEPAFDKMGRKWFRGQGEWTLLEEDQEDQMIEHMRHCYEYQPENKKGIKTAKELTWTNTAKKILEII